MPSPTLVLGILLAVAVAAAGILGKLYVRSEAKYATFVAQVETIGKEAEKKAKEKEAKDKETTKKATNDLQTRLTRLAADNQRLRQQRASSGVLPPVTNSSSSVNRACFPRAELDRALSEFVAETQGLPEEGDRAVILRDGWKEWWDGVSR